MLFPMLQEVEQYREVTGSFGGYNHQIHCREGQFFDMKNMTSQYFPILSPRQNRGIVRSFQNPQGMLDKEELLWIDDRRLFVNGEEKELKGIALTEGEKTLAKMGAFVIIMPDRVWYNTDKEECGYMECARTIEKGKKIEISMCQANGSAVVWHDAAYYEENEPKDGDYMMTENGGKASLKVYSGTTSIWMPVATTYIQIAASGIGTGFEKGDGIKLTIDSGEDALANVFVNEEENGRVSTNTCIIDKTDDCITIAGIVGKNLTIKDKTLTAERKVPDMAFITECNNRLWGCSKDGHELYCCKLGDVKNWNCFQGVSTDSWAATVGSDGKFTGAITYLGYPMFFKEDSLIKISPSATGGHQTKETKCRGVQKGSHQSLAIMNEILYYKASTGVCGYGGSLPYSVSDELGDERYEYAVAGVVGDRYYLSMKDRAGKHHLFVYDCKNGIWCREDDAEAMFFCRHKDDLYFVDAKDKMMKSVRGTMPYEVPEKGKEEKFDWYVESGVIGYSSPDHKYVARINLRISLEVGTNVDFYLQYDSCGEWEHKFNMAGSGTRSFSVPVIPKRCDHFKYKIVGKGGCKIHSITKTIEQGSDV